MSPVFFTAAHHMMRMHPHRPLYISKAQFARISISTSRGKGWQANQLTPYICEGGKGMLHRIHRGRG